ncbi:HAD-like domain-containing protein [Suillus clintonianus]|uniref:HAD-like domain-containing protein n=1 Tax=Suillus clintonianus TaxID=1904413 RepID=UPI001B85D39B|nr:HAD-like domain-containing protein [Suillus clintonianus]KAG2113224.1 HAD-like domain-containing protein [Suillus clintonianus]
MHRQILDDMLTTPRWSHLAEVWGDTDRKELTMIWHNLDVYQDTIPGLTELKRHVNILALSNGNFRLLLDLAKNQGVPWDGIFSSENFGSYKPNKLVYLSAAYHLSLPPHKIAMVAAHRLDLLAAASVGFKTIYVPRPTEDSREVRESMRSKKDGGEVDLVVKDFHELARLMGEARQS